MDFKEQYESYNQKLKELKNTKDKEKNHEQKIA